MRRAFVLSVALHGCVGLLLIGGTLLWPAGRTEPPPVLAEVELVEQPTPAVGPETIANPPTLKPEREARGPASRPAASAVPPDRTAAGTGIVSGARVIPASVDQKARNAPPAYPKEAVQQAEQGTVILNVHITADGRATAVDVIQSSGFLLLDQTARQAVAAWHFIAAHRQGTAVSSTMPVRIRFVLDDLVTRQ